MKYPFEKFSIWNLMRHPFDEETGDVHTRMSMRILSLIIFPFYVKHAGIDRMVTWRNPTTGEPELRPIYEVLSSHSARKAFAGNMYNKVKDPNLICALTGHKEGSKAFKIEWDLGSYAISLNP